MNAADVDGLVPCGDRSTPKGQRDDAIWRLLARLGFRAGAGAALTLDALDGEAGELLVRGKSARHDRLPLPHEVGAAVAVDLRHHRPPRMTRQVCVRMRAPRRGLSTGRAVTTSVARALRRAGLNPALQGAHLLRPS
jgi:integrase/recombinase XerD